jgi:RHS repeat-associated protein
MRGPTVKRALLVSLLMAGAALTVGNALVPSAAEQFGRREAGNRGVVEAPAVKSFVESVSAAAASGIALPRPRMKLAESQTTSGPDTVVVLTDTTYACVDSVNGSLYQTTFTIANYSSLRRYEFRITNGDPDGTHRISQLSLALNGHEVMNPSDVTTTVGFAVKLAEPVASNSLNITVMGAVGSHIDLDMISMPDPSYAIEGPTQYTKTEPPPRGQMWLDVEFTRADTANGPYSLILTNGSGGTHRVTSAAVRVNGTQVIAGSECGVGTARLMRQVSLDTFNSYSVDLRGAAGSYVTVKFTATDITAPVLAVTLPAADTTYVDSTWIRVSGNVADETPGTVQVGSLMAHSTTAPTTSFTDSLPLPADGTYPVTVRAVNSAGFATEIVRTVVRDMTAPDLRADSTVSSTLADSLEFTVSWRDTTPTIVTVDGDQVGMGLADTIQVKVPLDLGPNGIHFRATDALGNQKSFKRFVFRNSSNEPEAEDATVTRPELPTTETTAFANQVSFLYTGSNPLQTGMLENVVQPNLAAVLHGYVKSRDFGVLPNVVVKILGHSEYGQTVTREDGRFDLVVNGGSSLVVRFSKDGFLESQRSVDVPVQDYVAMDTVAMIGRSSKSYTVCTDTVPPPIVARFETDLNGDRQLTMLFSAGTRCSVTTIGGQTSTYTTFHVRLKEYTVGGDGDDAMPAALPPSTAYTYCVNMGVVEAEAAESQDSVPPAVRFSKPVVTYVKDFMGLPVGTTMPSGYYDRQLGHWVATADGWIVRVQSESQGVANLDTDGDGTPDDSARYVALGIDSTERRDVASLFAVGDSLVRVTLDHFTDEDFNPNEAENANAGTPTAASAGQPFASIDNASTTCGCVIENENRILGETIPIAGTPFALHYRSNRVPGDKAMRSVCIPLVGPTTPDTLEAIQATVDVAGRRYSRAFSWPGPDSVWNFSDWDGKDAYGRTVQGSVTATIRVGYEFKQSYTITTIETGGGSFNNGAMSASVGKATDGDRDVGRVYWTTQRVSLGAPSTAAAGLGGWTITPHHIYDTNGSGALYLGDGSTQHTNRQALIVKRWGGDGWPSDRNTDDPDGTIATARHRSPVDLVAGRDGSLFFTDAWKGTVGRIARDGRYHAIAGHLGLGGEAPADGIDATSALLSEPSGIALGSDGSVYFTDAMLNRVFRVDGAGKLWTVAGVAQGTCGEADTLVEGTLAVHARLCEPRRIALGPDGSVFVTSGNRILRIGTNGRIRTYAGTKTQGAVPGWQVEGKADFLSIGEVQDLACDAGGVLYFSEFLEDRVRRVTPDGHVSTWVHEPDLKPKSLAIGPDGLLYLTQQTGGDEAGLRTIFRREMDGTLSKVAGGLSPSSNFAEQDGKFARGAQFWFNPVVAVGPDGAIFLGEWYANGANGIYRMAPDLPGASASEILVPSRDGAVAYYFTLTGRHLRTVDARTGAELYRFNYDAGGCLTSVVEANGDVTTIERATVGGPPTAIVSPYGQVTTVTMDPTGKYLGTVTSPAEETHALGYEDDGLLHTFEDPAHHTWTHDYKYEDGRLEEETNADLAVTHFTGTTSGITRTVTRETQELRETRYVVQQKLDGVQRRFIHNPTGTVWSLVDSVAGVAPYGQVSVSAGPAGDTTIVRTARDPRFGWLAPVDSIETTKLPSGLTRTITRTRLQEGTKLWESYAVHGDAGVARFVAVSDSATATRTIRMSSAAGRNATVELDAAGRPTSIALGDLMAIGVDYDSRGKAELVQQGNRGWRFAYDAAGRVATMWDTLGSTTDFHRDSVGRETLVVLPGGGSLSLGYDAVGNVTSLRPPGSAVAHEFHYKPAGLLESYVPPVVPAVPDPATTYTYNGDGQLTHITRPDGQELSLSYGSTTGLLDSLTHPRGTKQFTYTSAGEGALLESITSPDSVMVSFDYDGPLLTSETWTGLVSGAVTRSYDLAFRASAEEVAAGGGALQTDFSYDADGLLTGAGSLTIARRNGDGLIEGTMLGAVSSSQDYDDYGGLTELAYTWPSGGFDQEILSRDAMGRITSLQEVAFGTDTTRGYRYDDAGRLYAVTTNGDTTARYWYDANGNRTLAQFGDDSTVTAWYDAQDRLDSVWVVGQDRTRILYAYTAAGELRQRVTGTDTTRYTYDVLGSLVEVAQANGDTIRYLVDGLGRRVGRKVNGAWTHRWLYEDGLRVAAELDGAGALRARYVYGTRGHVPDYVVMGGSTYRLITDQLGSVRAVVNVADGAVAERIAYDAWGNVTVDTNPGFVCLGYAGGLRDPATELVRFGARDYDPSVGRWTCRDPIGFGGGDVNLYAYVGAAPLDVSDPTGLTAADAIDIIETFDEHVKEMTRTGERIDWKYVNNVRRTIYVTTGIGKRFLGCHEQAEEVRFRLYDLHLHDQWAFSVEGVDNLWIISEPGFGRLIGPHWWLVARSSNPKDPEIVLDPWRHEYRYP